MRRPKVGIEHINSSEKRRMDILGGLALAGILLAPSLLVAAETMVEYRTRKPLFFQQRVGKGGVDYTNVKFQSMTTKHVTSLRGGSDQPEVTPIGQVVRATRLDEMPQVYNVIRGDISLVGIRPMPQAYVGQCRERVANDSLFDEWYECYKLNPGMTGPGQLYSSRFPRHDKKVITRRMELDIDGTYGATLKGDCQILAETPAVLFRQFFRIGHLQEQ